MTISFVSVMMCERNRGAGGVLCKSLSFQRAAGRCEAAGEQRRNGPARANRTGVFPQYGRRSRRSVIIGPTCDGTEKWARLRQAGWYRRSVCSCPCTFCRGKGFFLCLIITLTNEIVKRLFRPEKQKQSRAETALLCFMG